MKGRDDVSQPVPPLEWLQLGGDLHNFLPIVTSQTPVVSTSDLSLAHALQTVKKVMADNHNSRVGEINIL